MFRFAPGDRAENVRQVVRWRACSPTRASWPLSRSCRGCGQIALSCGSCTRRLHAPPELPFIEIHVDTDVEECARHDPKGLYARSRAGEISDFTGVDAPYEPPDQPEIRIDTAAVDVAGAVEQILAVLPDNADD